MSLFRAAVMIVAGAIPAGAQTTNMERLDAIRAFAAECPVLEVTISPAEPKYQVIRLNASAKEHAGERYGIVRLKVPLSELYTLVLLFSDVGNIAEYEIMPPGKGAPALRGNTRLIYPALVHDHDEEEIDSANLTLPKPWDHFELHLLGFAPDLLKAANEYLIWFRFADNQPADILMAATLLKGSADIAPEKLPAIFKLPAHEDD